MTDDPVRRWPGRSSSADDLADTTEWDHETPDPSVFGHRDDGLSDRVSGDQAIVDRGGSSRFGGLTGARFTWFWFLAGLAFGGAFSISGLFIRAESTPYGDGITVTGEVVSIAESTSSEGGPTYSPVVRFTDPATGESHRATRSISSSNRPDIGDLWEVSFPLGQPDKARVLGRWDWLFWGSFVTIGALAIVITLAITVRSVTRSRRR